MTRRYLTLPPKECRFAADQEAGLIRGYAAVFDELVPSFNEKVARGAFTRTLEEHRAASAPIVMLWAHDAATPIGKWSAVEDERGLHVEGRIVDDVEKGKEALALVRAGVVGGLSIGFRIRAAERGERGVTIITDAELDEVSLVAFPAAPGARVTGVRHAAGLAAFVAAIERGISELRRV